MHKFLYFYSPFIYFAIYETFIFFSGVYMILVLLFLFVVIVIYFSEKKRET